MQKPLDFYKKQLVELEEKHTRITKKIITVRVLRFILFLSTVIGIYYTFQLSKIPLIGNILVGKKAGEGVFGVSFKIKGPPKNLKTTVNPVKTLTPRFITRTLEKIKKN